MKNLIAKISIIFLIFGITSCISKKDEPVKLRVVSLQGKAKPVDIKTPDLNVKALQEQGRSYSTRSRYVETPPIDSKSTNQEYYSNSFYENKYNRPAVDDVKNQEQEIVYRNDFNKDAPSSNEVKYILDSGQSHQGKNPIIVQSNSEGKNYQFAPKAEGTVEFDLAEAKDDKKSAPVKKKAVVKESKKKTNTTGYFVQVGAFTNKANANKSLNYMKKFHKGMVQYQKPNYKVILGPFSKRSSAQNLYNEIKQSGHDALIINTSY